MEAMISVERGQLEQRLDSDVEARQPSWRPTWPELEGAGRQE